MDLIIATIILGPLFALAFSSSDKETDNGECVEKPSENKVDMDIEPEEEELEEEESEEYQNEMVHKAAQIMLYWLIFFTIILPLGLRLLLSLV